MVGTYAGRSAKNPATAVPITIAQEGEWLPGVLNFILPLLVIVLIWIMLMRKMGGGAGGGAGPGGIFNIGKITRYIIR